MPVLTQKCSKQAILFLYLIVVCTLYPVMFPVSSYYSSSFRGDTREHCNISQYRVL